MKPSMPPAAIPKTAATPQLSLPYMSELYAVPVEGRMEIESMASCLDLSAGF